MNFKSIISEKMKTIKYFYGFFYWMLNVDDTTLSYQTLMNKLFFAFTIILFLDSKNLNEITENSEQVNE